MCSLMKYWTDLYAEIDLDQLIESVNTMLWVAEVILAAQRVDNGARKRLS